MQSLTNVIVVNGVVNEDRTEYLNDAGVTFLIRVDANDHWERSGSR